MLFLFIPNQLFSQGCKFIILSTQCYCVILAYYAEPQITFRTGSDSVTPVIPLSSLYCLCLTDPLFLFLKGSDSNSPVSSLFTLPRINRKQKSHRKAVPTWVSQAINILPRSRGQQAACLFSRPPACSLGRELWNPPSPLWGWKITLPGPEVS